jgi:hypothetical protein
MADAALVALSASRSLNPGLALDRARNQDLGRSQDDEEPAKSAGTGAGICQAGCGDHGALIPGTRAQTEVGP